MAIDRLFDLSKDVAIVTGAGRGIGEGIAQVLSEAGAAVVLAARRSEEVERVAAAHRLHGDQLDWQTDHPDAERLHDNVTMHDMWIAVPQTPQAAETEAAAAVCARRDSIDRLS